MRLSTQGVMAAWSAGIGFGAGAIKVGEREWRASPLIWLSVQAAALWPHGLWMARRMLDRSDEPLGLAALVMLAFVLWRLRARLCTAPRFSWLAAAATLTVIANGALFVLPPLVCALVGALALAAGICAWLPQGAAHTPLAGLLVLALPLISSLQYYGGYPLRVLTAQISAWTLQLVGIDAERNGVSMWVRGQLVIVDAPCSGVQMAWMAYFCACAGAAMFPLRDGVFLRRLPLVSFFVLAGNALRNTVLVALESRPQGLDAGMHELIGVCALAAVCALVVVVMRRGREASRV